MKLCQWFNCDVLAVGAYRIKSSGKVWSFCRRHLTIAKQTQQERLHKGVGERVDGTRGR